MSTISPGSRARRRSRGRARVFSLTGALAVGLLGASCSSGSHAGGGQAPAPTPTSAPLCVARDPGPSPLRRMTRDEYGRTLRDLLGPNLVDSSGLPPDERALGFDNNADVVTESDLLIEQYQGLAEQAGAAVVGDLGRFLPCSAGGSGGTPPDDACALSFITDFGRRAWRRPLAAAEADALHTVFTDGLAAGDFTEGVSRVVEALLQSPQFLYRIEVGAGAAPDLAGAVSLDPYEAATRLSYLIWGSMPDDTLLAAAAGGQLVTPGDIEREARRLLADPRAHEVIAAFHDEWLALYKLADLDKDPVVYPTFNAAMRTTFHGDTAAFIDDVVWNGEGTLSGLLNPASGRAGLLTQPAFLAVYAKPNQSSPVSRGRFVREQLFCTTPPPPPSDIAIIPPGLDPRKTTRERFVEHTADPYCASCHVLLDPIGFAFEHYDGIGAWRDTEGDLPIDATGTLSETDVDGTVDGATALSARLTGSAEVSLCYATQWFRFGYGRGETAADACSLNQLATAFQASGGNICELLVALTKTDAFRYRRAEVTP